MYFSIKNALKTVSSYCKVLSKMQRSPTLKLQKCGTEEEMREVAGRICRNYLPGLWKIVEPKELEFRKVTGGLSNFIYMVGLPEDLRGLYTRLEAANDEEAKEIKDTGIVDEPRKVLIRIYGQVHGERAMDAIVTESVIFTLLSERRLGPKLYGVFSGGRIEEYIPARSLLTKELSEPAISMKIAEKTAAIHSMEIPLSKEGAFLWKTMAKWLRTVREEVFANGIKGKNDEEKAAIQALREINYELEIEWLKKYLASVESPIVFCHNDLQEGNILILENDGGQVDEFDESIEPQYPNPRPPSYDLVEECGPTENAPCPRPLHSTRVIRPIEAVDENEEDGFDNISHHSDSGEPKLYLIDFEYCAYNHRAFDIANHFQEWGYNYTHPEHPFYTEKQEDWPTLQQKEIFIREYLKHYTALTSDAADPEPNIDAINKLLAEVEAFTLASHLFWTLWSIVNANKSQIPFGYWEYGLSRAETYLRLKQAVIKKDNYGLPHKRKIEEVDI